MPAWRCLLPGGRWHFQHGPMDLIIEARGDSRAVALAHEHAWLRFAGLLQELVDELPALRAPVGAGCALRGVVARRMWAACRPYRAGFITPMAAVAGAVAQEILAGYARDGIARAWVNNGGDIALHLAPGASASVGICSDIAALDAAQLRNGLLPDGQLRIRSAMPVRGVGTSGWRGRSQSLGIADSVTVLARTAAEADAAVHPARSDLSSLRILGSVGEPINPEAWMWYHKNVGGERCPIVDTFWQTETGGHVIAPLPGATPLVPGSCTLPLPGIAAYHQHWLQALNFS
ncbi:AMP-binding protein [Verminephrobacter sp. Larva24]|nr:AMP-binding protein [Verminephrobacter sp. Larva24]